MKAREMMLANKVEVNALTVINDYSARFPKEIYQFHKENGLEYMQFIPCVELDPANRRALAPFSVSPEALGRFLCEVFDCWLADFIEGKPTTFIRWFDSLFFTYVGHSPPECTLLPECGNYVVVEHTGDVYSCDFFVEPQWKLGNIMEGNLADMLNSPAQTRFGCMKSDLPKACKACQWLSHCRGGCTKERLHNPQGHGAVFFCEAYKIFFEHADSIYRDLAEKWLAEQQGIEQAEAKERERQMRKIKRNDPCPCGSGKKYKRCCGAGEPQSPPAP